MGGWEGEGEGRGIDTDGWVMGPMCCDVPHLGCPKHTAKPMGRIVAKSSLAPSSFGVHPITCDVCVCVVCGVSCVVCVVSTQVPVMCVCVACGVSCGVCVCVVKHTAKPMGRIVAK